MTILKPCPFCGGPAQVASGGPGLHYVRCEGCTASTDDGSRERAIALWNNREATEARVVGEIVAWLRERSGTYHGRMYGECEPNKRRHLSERSCSYSDIANAIERGDYKESQP